MGSFEALPLMLGVIAGLQIINIICLVGILVKR